jgi:predicted aspartyl protease
LITGTVNPDGVPTVLLTVAAQTWPATVDTGFNGDLELPDSLRPFVNARFKGHALSVLASGQNILEEVFVVDFPFDGETAEADASFVFGGEILLGTHLLRAYHLDINFPARTGLLEKVV